MESVSLKSADTARNEDRASADVTGASLPMAHVRSEAEQALIDRLRAKQAARDPMVKWKVRNIGDGNCQIYPDHPDVELATAMTMQALGLTSPAALQNLLKSLADNARVGDKVDEERFQRLLSYVRSIDPRDEVEAMTAVQMALAHDATVYLAKLQANAQNGMQREAAANAFNKAARTATVQLEALKKYRSKGQKIVIERIDVKEGGQAIVGTVGRDAEGQPVVRATDGVEVKPAQTPRQRRPKAATPPPALTSASDEERLTLPFDPLEPLEPLAHPEIELVARRMSEDAPPPQPPKVNTGQRRWTQPSRRSGNRAGSR